MEQRYETRKPIEVSVEIAAFGRRFGRYRTRNVSYSGMFIECQLLPVYTSNVVKLTVVHGAWRFDLRAVVIHRSNRGIGVMRLDHNEGYAHFVMDQLGLAGPDAVDISRWRQPRRVPDQPLRTGAKVFLARNATT